MVLTIAAANAHGGVATLQLSSERTNPGATIEVIGDMTTDGSVILTLIAAGDGAVRPLATLLVVDDGHFQAFVELPSDLPGGSYTVTAANGLDFASAPLVITGPAVAGGEEGQLPGQDEAFVGAGPSAVAPGAGASDVVPPRQLVPEGSGPAASVPQAFLVAVLAFVVALALGATVRIRSGRPADP